MEVPARRGLADGAAARRGCVAARRAHGRGRRRADRPVRGRPLDAARSSRATARLAERRPAVLSAPRRPAAGVLQPLDVPGVGARLRARARVCCAVLVRRGQRRARRSRGRWRGSSRTRSRCVGKRCCTGRRPAREDGCGSRSTTSDIRSRAVTRCAAVIRGAGRDGVEEGRDAGARLGRRRAPALVAQRGPHAVRRARRRAPGTARRAVAAWLAARPQARTAPARTRARRPVAEDG